MESGFRGVAGLTAAPSQPGEPTGKQYHVWVTKWPLLHFYPPNLTQECLLWPTPTRTEILESVTEARQVDTLQSYTETVPLFLFSDTFCKTVIIVWKNLSAKSFGPRVFFVTKRFNYRFNFLNRYRNIQIFYFFLCQSYVSLSTAFV